MQAMMEVNEYAKQIENIASEIVGLPQCISLLIGTYVGGKNFKGLQNILLLSKEEIDETIEQFNLDWVYSGAVSMDEIIEESKRIVESYSKCDIIHYSILNQKFWDLVTIVYQSKNVKEKVNNLYLFLNFFVEESSNAPIFY